MCPGVGGVGLLGSRGCGGVEPLVFDWREHAQGAVSPPAVVEHLEVLEQGVGELDAGPPPSSVG